MDSQSTPKFPVGSRVVVVGGSSYTGMRGTVVRHRNPVYEYVNEVDIDGHNMMGLGFKNEELVLLSEQSETTTTKTRYRLVWGELDGSTRLSDDLEALQARMSTEHGDYIEQQTTTTTTTDWERIA